MKYLQLSTLLVLALALGTACTENPNDVSGKKKELSELLTKQREIADKILKLQKEIAKLDPGSKVEGKPKPVGVDTLQPVTFEHKVEVQGQVDAEQNALVLQQMPGVVTAIYVKAGDRVSAGQTLFITDASTYEKQIGIVETQANLARTAYEKQERLWSQGIGSEIQVLQAKTNKEAAEKQIQTLRATIEMTKAKSPISGVVDEVRVKLGDMAAPSAMMPGIRVVNSSRLVIKAKLSDSEIGKLKQGDKVEVYFPDIDKHITSTVSYVGQVIDRQTRTFNVEVRLDNANADYKANMLAQLYINDEAIPNALVVPTNVIQKTDDNREYLLVAEGDRVTKRFVVSGDSYNGNTVIKDGLKAGDKVITFGFSEVVDGQRISF
ncbi:MAG: efflux RND transporter periplasmic adaptor subunit [Chitinophagales bacterium]